MASINNCSNDQFGEVNNTRSPQRRVLFNSISESLCVLLVGVGFNNTRVSKNRVIRNSIFPRTSYIHDVYCFNSTRLLYKRVTCNSIIVKPSTDQPLHTPHPPNFLGPLTNYIWTVVLKSGRGLVCAYIHCVTATESFHLQLTICTKHTNSRKCTSSLFGQHLSW